MKIIHCGLVLNKLSTIGDCKLNHIYPIFASMFDNGFITQERLKSKKRISQLFSDGKSVKGFPVLAVYTLLETEALYNQVGFSVSKKKFKRAVDRNLLKRRILESYRLNKSLLERGTGHTKVALMFVYMPKEILDFEQIEKGVKKALNNLVKGITDQ